MDDYRIGFSVLNSAFTLYWDVIRDWQIFFPWMPTFLGDPQGGSSGRSLYSLGRPLFFGSTVPYILATLFNAIVRLFWVGKITLMYSVVDHLLRPKETDEAALPRLLLVDVSLKVLEVLRRWVWVFFRVEREWVVSLPSGTGVRTGEGLSYDMVDIESND